MAMRCGLPMCKRVPARLHCDGHDQSRRHGQESAVTVEPGEAVEIMTGRPVPAGADAVVMVEYTESAGDRGDREALGQGWREHCCRQARKRAVMT